MRQYCQNNKERIRKVVAKRHAERMANDPAYRAKRTKYMKEYNKNYDFNSYYEDNKESRKKSRDKYRAKPETKVLRAAEVRKRQAAKLQATPAWANDGYIKLFYKGAKIEEERTGRPVHVDHIVPLQGKNVCGLHYEDNLQLMFAEDNQKKSNSIGEKT